jgi:hypothetical protein
MNKPDKDQYYKIYSTVIIGFSVNSSSLCKICKKNIQDFSVFLGTEKRLSTLWGSCCGSCLPLLVKEAYNKGEEQANDSYNSACKKYYDECVQYVRKTKLDNLGNIIE